MDFRRWLFFSFRKNSKNKPELILKKKRKKIFNALQEKIFPFSVEYIEGEKIFLYNFYYKQVPHNYNFEIEKTIKKINRKISRKIGFQFPEGLQKFYVFLSEFLMSMSFFIREPIISNRVSYGACCIDDIFFKLVGASNSFHYGHSCLVPIIKCLVPISYIFLEIYFDQSFLVEILKKNFRKIENSLNFLSTVQFISCFKKIENELIFYFKKIKIPQNKPLSPGETLGCTSPSLWNCKNIVYIGDGRFHLESCMMESPNSRFFQYNPFSHLLFVTEFSIKEFLEERKFILLKSFLNQKNFCFIIGALGHQGDENIFKKIKEIFKIKKVRFFSVFSTEISIDKLNIMGHKKIDIYIQIACPRLSYDWGKIFNFPLLTSFEISVLFGFTIFKNINYPMDYFSGKGGFWTTYMHPKKNFFCKDL